MSAAAESRLKALDGVLDRQPASEALADELFAVVEAVGAQPSLRRALTDPSTPDEVRSQLTQSLFGDRVSGAAVAVLTEAARARWGTAGSFVAALERQGVRALLRTAQDAGRLDELEDQLFKVERLVDANPELRRALGDRRARSRAVRNSSPASCRARCSRAWPASRSERSRHASGPSTSRSRATSRQQQNCASARWRPSPWHSPSPPSRRSASGPPSPARWVVRSTCAW